MAPTSTTCWSRTAGAGGIGSRRLGTRYWKRRARGQGRLVGWSVAGAGVGVAEETLLERAEKSLRYMPVLRPVSLHLSPRLETRRAEN